MYNKCVTFAWCAIKREKRNLFASLEVRIADIKSLPFGVSCQKLIRMLYLSRRNSYTRMYRFSFDLLDFHRQMQRNCFQRRSFVNRCNLVRRRKRLFKRNLIVLARRDANEKFIVGTVVFDRYRVRELLIADQRHLLFEPLLG